MQSRDVVVTDHTNRSVYPYAFLTRKDSLTRGLNDLTRAHDDGTCVDISYTVLARPYVVHVAHLVDFDVIIRVGSCEV